MKKNEPISHIMTTDVITVHTAQNVSEVRKLLAGKGIHHIPVVSGKKLLGIISSTDLMQLDIKRYGANEKEVDAMMDHEFSIENVMVKDPVSLKEGQTVRDAATLLSEGSYHSLPVQNDAGELVGIVTSTDLIRYLLSQY